MNALNYVINFVFIFEMVIKIIALGFIMYSGSCLRENWNIMDFVLYYILF